MTRKVPQEVWDAILAAIKAGEGKAAVEIARSAKIRFHFCTKCGRRLSRVKRKRRGYSGRRKAKLPVVREEKCKPCAREAAHRQW